MLAIHGQLQETQDYQKLKGKVRKLNTRLHREQRTGRNATLATELADLPQSLGELPAGDQLFILSQISLSLLDRHYAPEKEIIRKCEKSLNKLCHERRENLPSRELAGYISSLVWSVDYKLQTSHMAASTAQQCFGFAIKQEEHNADPLTLYRLMNAVVDLSLRIQKSHPRQFQGCAELCVQCMDRLLEKNMPDVPRVFTNSAKAISGLLEKGAFPKRTQGQKVAQGIQSLIRKGEGIDCGYRDRAMAMVALGRVLRSSFASKDRAVHQVTQSMLNLSGEAEQDLQRFLQERKNEALSGDARLEVQRACSDMAYALEQVQQVQYGVPHSLIIRCGKAALRYAKIAEQKGTFDKTSLHNLASALGHFERLGVYTSEESRDACSLCWTALRDLEGKYTAAPNTGHKLRKDFPLQIVGLCSFSRFFSSESPQTKEFLVQNASECIELVKRSAKVSQSEDFKRELSRQAQYQQRANIINALSRVIESKLFFLHGKTNIQAHHTECIELVHKVFSEDMDAADVTEQDLLVSVLAFSRMLGRGAFAEHKQELEILEYCEKILDEICDRENKLEMFPEGLIARTRILQVPEKRATKKRYNVVGILHYSEQLLNWKECCDQDLLRVGEALQAVWQDRNIEEGQRRKARNYVYQGARKLDSGMYIASEKVLIPWIHVLDAIVKSEQLLYNSSEKGKQLLGSLQQKRIALVQKRLELDSQVAALE